MNLDRMRTLMSRKWSDFVRVASDAKDSSSAGLDLIALYDSFDESQKALADVVAAEWVASPDFSTRWAGRVLVGHFEITSALPAVRASAARLQASVDPYELAEAEADLRLLERAAAWRDRLTCRQSTGTPAPYWQRINRCLLRLRSF